MTAIEYANRILYEFRRGKKAKAVRRGDEPLVVLIECHDGTVERVHGYWATEIMSRVEEETKAKP